MRYELWYSPWHNQIFYTYRRRVINPGFRSDHGKEGWPTAFTYTRKYVNGFLWIKLDEEPCN